MIQLNTINIQMIMDILQGSRFKIEENPTHVKYVNQRYDIVIKNNTSIIVIDKRLANGCPVIYKDLRTAHNQILGL